MCVFCSMGRVCAGLRAAKIRSGMLEFVAQVPCLVDAFKGAWLWWFSIQIGFRTEGSLKGVPSKLCKCRALVS